MRLLENEGYTYILFYMGIQHDCDFDNDEIEMVNVGTTVH